MGNLTKTVEATTIYALLNIDTLADGDGNDACRVVPLMSV
jgi:hypothetical protein